MPDSWRSEELERHFTEIMRRALAGEPQFVSQKDGTEVVVISRDAYDASRRPGTRNVLLAGGPRDNDDHDLEDAIAELREAGVGLFGRYPS